ncbi:ankyrin [Apiospora sp. TS-2023a]
MAQLSGRGSVDGGSQDGPLPTRRRGLRRDQQPRPAFLLRTAVLGRRRERTSGPLRVLPAAGRPAPRPPTNWNNNLILAENKLGAAAHRGHDRIVRTILASGHPDVGRETKKATQHAAYANQPQTLRTLLDHYRQMPKFSEAELVGRLDYCLAFCSCPRGNAEATAVLLEQGADPDATDFAPRSCLQLAAKAGDARTIKLLLDAGASLEAPRYRRNRVEPEIDVDRGEVNQPRRQRRDALGIAKKKNWTQIVRLIEEKKREIEQSKEGTGSDNGAAA